MVHILSQTVLQKKVFTCTTVNGNILVHMLITIFWLRQRCAQPVVGSTWSRWLGMLFCFLSSKKLACCPFWWQHVLSFMCSTVEDKNVRKCRGMWLAAHTTDVLVQQLPSRTRQISNSNRSLQNLLRWWYLHVSITWVRSASSTSLAAVTAHSCECWLILINVRMEHESEWILEPYHLAMSWNIYITQRVNTGILLCMYSTCVCICFATVAVSRSFTQLLVWTYGTFTVMWRLMVTFVFFNWASTILSYLPHNELIHIAQCEVLTDHHEPLFNS